MKPTPKLNWTDFSNKYCERMDSTTEELKENLLKLITTYQPVGFVMLEAQLLDSSYLGSLCIIAFGPNNTLKQIPDHPISPRGLASDMSLAVAWIEADEVGKGN